MSNSELDQAISQIGESINHIVQKAISVQDVRAERTSSLEFKADKDSGVYNKGLVWDGETSRKLVYRANPDRLWCTEIIDLSQESYYAIGNVEVLNDKQLGPTVTKSSLVKVGTLQDLHTSGNLNIDGWIHYNTDSNRLGLGTDSPNGHFTITDFESEFIVDIEADKVKIGTYTTSDFAIITDDRQRLLVTQTGNVVIGRKDSDAINVNVHGKIGVNVNNFNRDADITTAGPVRFQGKKQEVNSQPPKNGVYKQGDIVWNDNPKPTGYAGWICTRSGKPGVWKAFGQISS